MTVLYSTVLYCTVLHCTVLYCTVLYCKLCEFSELHYTQFLMSASPMFAGMMETGLKEAKEGKTDIQSSFTVGKELVRFIYTGNIEEDILVEHVVEFLELGERLVMDTLKMFAEDKMLNILNMENMTRFYVVGDRYGAGRIREEAKSLCKINLKKMMENPGWENEFGSKKELITELWKDFI